MVDIPELVKYWSDNLGVNENLIWAIIRTESGGDPSAVGRSGEIGLMQVMPKTAEAYGISREQLFDPYYNIQAGVSYLRDLIDRYGIEGAIQAYNIGETKYDMGIRAPVYLSKVMANLTPGITGLVAEIPKTTEVYGAGLDVTKFLLMGIAIGGLIYGIRKRNLG